MMSDRLDAQLRQHLLGTADEHAAEGQLAALVDRVAITPQRPSIAARLTWFPGRIGRFPSTAVRLGLVAVALVLAIVAGAIIAGSIPQPRSTVFEGTWTAIDPGDESELTLEVGAGATPTLHFEDNLASGAACAQDEVKVFRADGTGAIDGDTLVATYPNGGGCGVVSTSIAGQYVHDATSDTMLDQDGVRWIRVPENLAPGPQRPTSPLTALPSPPTSEATLTTFTSTIHGIAIDYPDTWRSRAATEPWTGGELFFDSPAADVISDPALGDSLYLLVASQPYANLTPEEARALTSEELQQVIVDWRTGVLSWTCPFGGNEMWGWTVDGEYSWQQAPCDSGSLVGTATRGYLIRLVASSDVPGLVEAYNWDWLVPLLESVDLRPEDALDDPDAALPDPTAAALASPDPCIQFDGPGTYAARAGSMLLTVSVAPAPGEAWIGDRERFDMLRAACGDGQGSGAFRATELTQVFTETCGRTGASVAVASKAEAVAAVSAANGVEVVAQSDVTLGGYPGTLLDLRLPGRVRQCADAQTVLADGLGAFDQGGSYGLYLIDVDGRTLAVVLSGYGEWDQDVTAEVQAMLDSIEIQNAEGGSL